VRCAPRDSAEISTLGEGGATLAATTTAELKTTQKKMAITTPNPL